MYRGISSMELSALARYQKRIIDWSTFLEAGVPDAALKNQIVSRLSELKKLVAQCWSEGSVSTQAQASLCDLERQLEALNEEARLRVGGNTPLKKEEGLELRSAQAQHRG